VVVAEGAPCVAVAVLPDAAAPALRTCLRSPVREKRRQEVHVRAHRPILQVITSKRAGTGRLLVYPDGWDPSVRYESSESVGSGLWRTAKETEPSFCGLG